MSTTQLERLIVDLQAKYAEESRLQDQISQRVDNLWQYVRDEIEKICQQWRELDLRTARSNEQLELALEMMRERNAEDSDGEEWKQ